MKKRLMSQKPFAVNTVSVKKTLTVSKQAILNGNTSLLAASIAYFGILAFFPLMAALVAVAGSVLSDMQAGNLLANMAQYLPKDIGAFIAVQLSNAAAHQQANIWIAIVALLLSIYGVSGAVESIIRSINSIYHLKDTRSFVRQKMLSLTLTIVFILGMAVVLPLVFIGASFLSGLGVPPALVAVFGVMRWVVLTALLFLGITIVYHYAPALNRRAWRWWSWGTVTAVILWLGSTIVFFVYLQHFANFSNSYSLFAGIIALMIWINLGAFSLLVGAHVNKSFEQTLVKQ